MSASEFQAWRWLEPMLKARGLATPDERALYEYKLTEPEIAQLKSVLLACFKGSLPQTPRLVGAAFCLWTAYWFQREFEGGQWSWAEPLDAISAPNDPNSRALLVTEGMDFLRREIRKINGHREFLITLVIEGGFPSRLISSEGGWLTRYVEAVTLAAAHGDNSLSAVLDHAEHYQFIIPASFRAESFLHLAAELAHHVADLRRRLANNGISEGAVEWLDHEDPHWRDRLPVATDDGAARRLVEGLVRASPHRAVMPVSCRRILKRSGDRWSFAIRMDIEGRIDDEDLPGEVRARLQSVNRARILPAGMLERKGLPAIGVANRTESEDWRGWAVESLLRRGPVVVDEFPLEADARLVFSIGAGSGLEFVPTGGARVTSDVLVFKEETAANDDDLPASLLLVGTGSIKERDARLYVLVPSDADVSAQPGGEVGAITSFAERILLRIQGAASIKIDGDRYVVRAGADRSDFTVIEAIGHSPDWVGANYPVYLGCPGFLLHHGNIKRKGDKNSLRMRVAGRKEGWTPFDPKSLHFGVVEIAALDKEAILDRLMLVHLPNTARIRVSVLISTES